MKSSYDKLNKYNEMPKKMTTTNDTHKKNDIQSKTTRPSTAYNYNDSSS